MNRAELQALLEELGVRPSRRLGQHFLLDPNLLDALVRDAAPAPAERILEIGPGPGLLTERLLAAGAAVTAVELDHRFAAYLRRRFRTAPAFRLIEADACRVDYAALFPEAPWRCVANLPYRITGPFLARLCLLETPPNRMHLLLQREAARRLTAEPGTPEYGALSVLVRYGYRAEIVRRVPAEVFYPRPRVQSAFVVLQRHVDFPPAAPRKSLQRLVRAVFQHRRKRIGKVLAAVYRDARVDAVFAEARVSPDARPGELTPAEFARLALAFGAAPGGGRDANASG